MNFYPFVAMQPGSEPGINEHISEIRHFLEEQHKYHHQGVNAGTLKYKVIETQNKNLIKSK